MTEYDSICEICGSPCPSGEIFCSPACKKAAVELIEMGEW